MVILKDAPGREKEEGRNLLRNLGGGILSSGYLNIQTLGVSRVVIL